MKNRSLEYWIAVLFLVLLVNTGYIAAFSSATIFYMTNVLGHVVLGTALTIALLFILRRSGLLRGAPAAVGFLLLAFVFGAVLTYAGNVHDNAWILLVAYCGGGAGRRGAHSVRLEKSVAGRRRMAEIPKGLRSRAASSSSRCRSSGMATRDFFPIPTIAS